MHAVRCGVALPLMGLLLVGAACEHAQPFGVPYTEPNAPYDSAFPRRLTFNPANDEAPAWLPDGSGIIYSYQMPQPDSEQCLGILPAGGGHLTWSACPLTPPLATDSTRVLTQPAVGPAGVLVYLREHKLLSEREFTFKDLVVATLGNPTPGRVVLSLAYWAPDSLLHVAVKYLQWLSAQTLVWVAVVDTNAGPPPVPSEIVRFDLSTAPASMTVLGGTGGASSVAADSGGALYYTVRGDSRVYRYRDGEPPDTVYDFGAAGTPIDVQVRGNVLVADVNGGLYRVDLGSKSVAPMATPDSMPVSDAVLSPSGTRVVVQVSRDLWLLQVP
jgi:WD40-like Beta Propeller Repeat